MAKLLLADDSITIQKVVELILAEEGFEIKTAGNGADAFSLIQTFKPDIVLADIEMPKMNGYQLCEKIKSSPEGRNIPVILLAGAFEPVDEELAKKVGAEDVLIKPFESEDLISKVNASLMAVAEAGALEEAVPEPAGPILEALPSEAAPAEEDLWGIEEGPVETEAIEIAELEPAAEAQEAVIEEALLEEAVMPEAVEEVAPIAPKAKAPKAVEEIPPAIGVPSKEAMSAALKEAMDKSIREFISGLDLKADLIKGLSEGIKDTAEKVLWELAPELTERLLKETLKGALVSIAKEVEKVVWETVPDLAESIIKKEIEKIRSEV